MPEASATPDFGFKKFDDNKPRPPFKALDAVWALTLHGAEKYGANNCYQATPEDLQRYQDALFRHLMDYRAGKFNVEDNGHPCLAAVAWNALILLELELRAREKGGGK